jgi:hypothetical protein
MPDAAKVADREPPQLGLVSLLNVLRWLVVDTFKHSVSSSIFWVMLLICLGAIIFCFGIGFEGGEQQLPGGPFQPADISKQQVAMNYAAAKRDAAYSQLEMAGTCLSNGAMWQLAMGAGGGSEAALAIGGEYLIRKQAEYVKPWPKPLQGPGADLPRVHGKVTYFFGQAKVDIARDRTNTVKMIHVVLGQWVAGTAGLVLAIIFTAGFLPSFLEPSSATVLLAKPVPRWLLLMGKVLGVTAFLGLLCGLFIVGTWWALALKTGVWSKGYLLCWPLLVFHFLLVYSFSTLLAVMTRNTAVCVFGTIVFWLICYGVNYGRHWHVAGPAMAHPGIVKPLPDGTPPPPIAQQSATGGLIVDAGYWVLPKPADLVIILEESMDAHENFGTLARSAVILEVKKQGKFLPMWSMLSSMLGAALFLAMAAWEFHKMDY